MKAIDFAFLRVVPFAAFVLLACVFGASAQSPSVARHTVETVLSAKEFCLEIAETERRVGGHVQIAKCDGKPGQLFVMGPSWVTWFNDNENWGRSWTPRTGDLCLGSSGANKPVELVQCLSNDGKATNILRWCERCVKSATPSIVQLVHSSDLCLTVSTEPASEKSALSFSECADTDRQRWTRTQIGARKFVN